MPFLANLQRSLVDNVGGSTSSCIIWGNFWVRDTSNRMMTQKVRSAKIRNLVFLESAIPSPHPPVFTLCDE